MDGGSRWGVKGSNELADGLSAIYQFEHKFSTENAGMDGGGRLAHVGLSGGFGTVTFGQIWSASFNATGAITDNSMLWGDSGTSYRVDNALSYSNSVGGASLQIDAIMDSSRDTGEAVDQVEFGMSIDLGDIGKLAFGYVESKDTNVDDAWVHVPEMVVSREVSQVLPVEAQDAMYFFRNNDADEEMEEDDSPLIRIEVLVDADLDSDSGTDGVQSYFDDDGDLIEERTVAFLNAITRLNDSRGIDHDGATDGIQACDVEDEDTTCHTVVVYAQPSAAPDLTTNVGTGATGSEARPVVTAAGDPTESYHILEEGEDMGELRIVPAVVGVDAVAYRPAVVNAATVEEDGVPNIDPGYKGTHVAAEFGLGGVTAFVGYSSTENNGGALDIPTKAADKPETGDIARGADGMLARTGSSETKMAHLGVRGSLGDGGMSYVLQYRSVDDAGTKTSPFMFHMSKSLGDGASAHIEHANNDDGKGGKTWLGLKVGF